MSELNISDYLSRGSVPSLLSLREIDKFNPRIRITKVETHFPTASQDSKI